MSRSTLVTTGIVALSIALALVLSSRNGAGSDAIAETPVTAPVHVARLVPEALPGQVRAGGFLRARNDITISAERAGRVLALPVPEGGPVRAGDVVARLDDTIAEADLAQARAAAREAGLDPTVPAGELERARAGLRRAEHELAVRRPATPIAGVVEVHHVDAGEYVVPGTPLVDVLDLGALILDIDLDPELVAAIGRARVTVEGRAVKVRRVARRADATTRRFRVELELEPGGLRPGMHAEALFVLPAEAPAFYAPKAAVRRVRGEDGVFVVRDGQAHWIPVVVAPVAYRPDLWRLESAGLAAAGESLVVRGFSGLRHNGPVEVVR